MNEIIEKLMVDPNVTDISFNGKEIWIQHNQKGRYKIEHDIQKEEVENYIKQLTYSNNEEFNDENPILDTEYPNLRVNAIHKSVAPYGNTLSLRLSKPSLKINNYDKEIPPKELFDFLETCIKANLNILISGKTGSGKTELQKYLTGFINDKDKIVLIEDTLDTHIKNIYPKKDILSWQINKKLEKPILFDDLIKARLRNNPDWIIISETRGSEAYDMLKSILSGHKIITTIHSNNCKNSVKRLIHMYKEKYQLDQKMLGTMISELFDIGIYLSHKVDEKESRHVLASLFVVQCYQSIVKVAQEEETGKLPIRVNFVLDEFANMPSIKNFSNKITVSRGRNIRFYLIIQDFDQLKERYREQAGTIKSNCNNWLYLLTADNNTAQEISKRLGKYTIETPRSSLSTKIGNSDFNISSDRSLTGRELMTSDELMKFEFGEGLFLMTRMYPIKSRLPMIYDYNLKIDEENIEYPFLEKNPINHFDLDAFRKEKKINDELGVLAEIPEFSTKLRRKTRENQKQ